jgi:predicted nucleic acid-binding Zn ribbon protein
MSQFNENHPKGKCPVCGKPVAMRTVKGGINTPEFCSKVCGSMKRYQKRFVGGRAEMYMEPTDLEKKRHE